MESLTDNTQSMRYIRQNLPEWVDSAENRTKTLTRLISLARHAGLPQCGAPRPCKWLFQPLGSSLEINAFRTSEHQPSTTYIHATDVTFESEPSEATEGRKPPSRALQLHTSHC